MTIERSETIILSENERKAFELVLRIIEEAAERTYCPEIKHNAKIADHALKCFNYFTKTENE